MKKIFILIFLLVSNLSYAQIDWHWISPPLGKSTFENVEFVNSSTGYLVGGPLFRTINGGVNWQIYYNTRNDNYNDIQFINEQTGFAGGVRILSRTTNGGNSWELIKMENIFDRIHFIDLNTGYAMNSSSISKTTDGGSNWFNVFSGSMTSIFFINETAGFCIKNRREIFGTINGGSNWSQQFYNDSVRLEEIKFFNSQTGFACGENPWIDSTVIYKTTNSGINWYRSFAGPDGYLYNMRFIDSNTIFSSGNKLIVKSTNLGLTWTILQPPPVFFRGVGICSQSVFFGYSGYGILYRSSDQGLTWSNLNQQFRNIITDVYFVDQNTGYMTADSGSLFTTSDGGESWVYKNIAGQTDLIGVRFFNPDTGFVICSGSNTFKTVDGGINWIPGKTFSGHNLKKIYFTNSTTGYILSASHILKTTNVGLDWTVLPITANDIQFVNDNTGFIVNGNNLMKTTNGGSNWGSSLINSIGGSYYSISFPDENTGYDSGSWQPSFNQYFGLISKTTNGGINWITHSFQTYGKYQILFLNSTTGFVVDGYGFVWKTTNGTSTWEENIYPVPISSKKLYFYDMNTGYIFGNEGVLMKTTNAGGNGTTIVGINNFNQPTPTSFSLHQNYPNPFNPSTKIKFDIPKGSLVRLKVYDMLGREVAELVNEKMNAGVYEYEWNGVGLPSGVYFYKLEAGEFIKTRRMVLIK